MENGQEMDSVVSSDKTLDTAEMSNKMEVNDASTVVQSDSENKASVSETNPEPSTVVGEPEIKVQHSKDGTKEQGVEEIDGISNAEKEPQVEVENGSHITAEKKRDEPGTCNSQLSENDVGIQMDYRTGKSGAITVDSSDTEDSSTDSDDEKEKETEKNADEGQDSTSKQIDKAYSTREGSPEAERRVRLNRHGFEDIRTKGELLPEELPPLEELTITVDETVEMKRVGSVKSVVGILVIIQSCENIPPLNDDTILFLEGRTVLGQVFEIFGPVQAPWYSVRFNNDENIKNKGIEVGSPVFCAPKEESFTSYVFVNTLKKIKGSDASWDDNNEPPEKHIEFSDDESERAAKSKGKKKKHLLGSDQTSEDCLPQMEKRSKGNTQQNGQPHQNYSRQPGSYRPRNPFQGPRGARPNRPHGHPGAYNPRQGYNPRDPGYGPGQGSRSSAPLPSFGGQPRFQQPVSHNAGSQFVQNGTNQGSCSPAGSRQSFQPMGGFGCNPQQPFGNNVRPVPLPVPPPAPQNQPINQNRPPWQSNVPFRSDIPPPTFNRPAGQSGFQNNPPNVQNGFGNNPWNVQNSFNNATGSAGQNTGQGQPPPNLHKTAQGQPPPNLNPASQGPQNPVPNQFVFNASSQQSFQVRNSAPQNVVASQTFPQNGQNGQFGQSSNQPMINNQAPQGFNQNVNPVGQYSGNANQQLSNNFSRQYGNNPTNQQQQSSNNQFQQRFQGPSQNMFQRNTNQVPANSNQAHEPVFQSPRDLRCSNPQQGFNSNNNGGNFSSNPAGNGMKIHGLNPGMQSNSQPGPVTRRVGYEQVQMGSSTMKPYRPEILQNNNYNINP